MLHDTYLVFFNFWRPSRYCSSSKHYVLRDSQQFRLIVFSPKARQSFILVSSEGPSPSRYDDFICSCFTVKHRNS
ncbi:hypothetical protein EPK33_11040 [Enterococcus faecalis]|nr:hypothetical protein [Enterococcus faecalis]EGO8434556.1 hypothetical protein [Enterococcus faecalis]EGO8604003.1 hypothetical protein [Enterococcus faecalis]EGO8856792.1 hypothetical protein [Enterococcus faecalis]EGO8899407.1 hypothetical protein [Enterococcus faecalis]